MKRLECVVLVGLSLVMSLVPVSAQQATPLTASASQSGGQIQITGDLASSNSVPSGAGTINLTVNCPLIPPGTVDCTLLTAEVMNADGSVQQSVPSDRAPAPTPRKATFTINRFLFLNTTRSLRLAHRTLTASAASQVSVVTAPTTAVAGTLSEALAAECIDPSYRWPAPYQGNTARFLVTPRGVVLQRPDRPIDEDDVVIVRVPMIEGLLPRLVVRRLSAIRQPNTMRVLGEESRIGGLFEQAAGAPVVPPRCSFRDFELADFAPGKGEVEISIFTDQGDERTGLFDFNVSPLYAGAFSLGVARSDLVDPQFGLRSVDAADPMDDADQFITVTSDPETRNRGEATPGSQLQYVVFYTPFLGTGDVLKRGIGVSPTFGVALDTPRENVFLGAAVDWQAKFYVMFGWHFGRINSLAKESGLIVGSRFDGDVDDIPVVREWGSEFFFGAAIDVRVAVKFLRDLFQTPS